MQFPFQPTQATRWCRAGAMAAALACAPLMASAITPPGPPEPFQINLTGTVTSAESSWAALSGTALSVSAVFGLDAAAGNSELKPATADESEYRVWTFVGEPYRSSMQGFGGNPLINQMSMLVFETIDNVLLTAGNNPWQLEGTFDAMALLFYEDNGNGTSTEAYVYLLNPDSNWFDDGGLPSAIPTLGVGGFSALGEAYLDDSSGNTAGYALMSFDTLEVSPVPEPAAGWMLAAGLIGVLGLARRSSSAARRRQ